MKSVSVIIVEDDAFVAADIASKAKRIGCQVLGIANRVEQAVEMVTRFCPNLALIGSRPREQADCIMTAKLIQLHCNHLPIIFLSTELDRNAVERVKLGGPYGFVANPLVEQELISEVEKILQVVSIQKARSTAKP
ncbi:MAG: hypothetical protein QNJ22_09035 [Desulfosarcinaceae bacterium]|nr:hypothetical protein [Desulfosarcinaceae bacterium]